MLGLYILGSGDTTILQTAEIGACHQIACTV